MDASQLRYPETVHLVPKHKFCIFWPVEGQWNTPKQYQTSLWVQWRCLTTWIPRNSALRLRRWFYIFYLLKVTEILQNTPKHQFGCDGVEWMLHNFGIPKQCIQTLNTGFAYFYLSKVSEMLRNTPKHHYGSTGVERMLHNFGTPK
jgi:hypothetical protein